MHLALKTQFCNGFTGSLDCKHIISAPAQLFQLASHACTVPTALFAKLLLESCLEKWHVIYICNLCFLSFYILYFEVAFHALHCKPLSLGAKKWHIREMCILGQLVVGTLFPEVQYSKVRLESCACDTHVYGLPGNFWTWKFSCTVCRGWSTLPND